MTPENGGTRKHYEKKKSVVTFQKFELKTVIIQYDNSYLKLKFQIKKKKSKNLNCVFEKFSFLLF